MLAKENLDDVVHLHMKAPALATLAMPPKPGSKGISPNAVKLK